MQDEDEVHNDDATVAPAQKTTSKTSTGGYRNSLTDHVDSDDPKRDDGGP